MNLDILNRISQLENNKKLNILFLAFEEQAMELIKQFKNFQFNFSITCKSLFMRGYFSSRIHSDNIKFYLYEKFSNNQQYDVIITDSFRYQNLGTLFNKYKFKYVINLFEQDLVPTGYSILSSGLFKRIQQIQEKEIVNQTENVEQKKVELSEEQKQKIAQKNELFKEFVEQYQIKPVKYGKYGINYLYDVVPGKISIIMIVSQRNNAFADLIRQLKAQNVESVEYIIIDNAAGFRNNVKPNIRYGEKMPIDFCQYHAKQISSGQYLIILNENSKSFEIADYISKGKYETR